MRLAVKISGNQETRLRELAARRGEEDFSKLVEEAIDLYLAQCPPRNPPTPQEAAKTLDRLREEIGPLGFPVRDLIDDGRHR
jgi:hypothetical protein